MYLEVTLFFRGTHRGFASIWSRFEYIFQSIDFIRRNNHRFQNYANIFEPTYILNPIIGHGYTRNPRIHVVL